MLKTDKLYTSLIEDQFDQGDPNIVHIPDTARSLYRYRYYAFVTGDSEYDRKTHPDKAFPCYGSDDLFTWHWLGPSLETKDNNARWAPCIGYYPDLHRPFVMLYSRARGTGEEAHVQHKIRRADSVSPEGPYVDSGEVLTQDFDFAIDPNVYRDRNGQLMMAFATDYVDDYPIGTGLAEIAIAEDLRKTVGAAKVMTRATADWQMYDPARTMPWKAIPNVDWSRGDKVKWHCVEGPVGGVVGPTGRRFAFYSAGNYSHLYAVGILEEQPDGTYKDLSTAPKSCLLAPQPDRGFYSVGRIGFVEGADGTMYASYHARFGSPAAPRRMGLALLKWSPEGLPYCARE